MSTASPTESAPAGHVDRRTGRAGDVHAPTHEWVGEGSLRRLVIRSHDLARELLRLPEGTEQAGFNADQLRATSLFRHPMLYTEGAEHREQRRLAARYFAPRTVTTRHRAVITELADEVVSDLEASGGGRLDLPAFHLAVRVVNEIVGLTESDQAHMATILEGFFVVPPPTDAPRWRQVRHIIANQRTTLRFWWGHVRPAVRARRRHPTDDVISALVAKGLRDRDILIECVTYAAAGMVTTRQLMTAAAWHLLDRPALRERYLAGDSEDRARIVAEVLRLEPVAGTLIRRATTDLTIGSGGAAIVIPAGSLIEIEVRMANADPSAVGDAPLALRPDRCPVQGVERTGLAFGSGHHSCPGEWLALEETDLFLQRLLRTQWEVVAEPRVVYNDLVQGYDLAPLIVRRLGS